MKKLSAIDLCCGAGGWAVAARGLPIEIIAAVDMWDVCCRTFVTNHPETEVICGNLKDAKIRRKLNAYRGKVQLVLGAIPCEWLSMRRHLGNSVSDKELAVERGTLAAVLNLIKRIDPAYWVLEDVKGLAAELPAGVPWLQIDSEHYSAQRRKRIYVGEFPPPLLQSCACGEVLADKLRPGPYRIGRRGADREAAFARAFAADKVYAAMPDRKSPTVCAWGSRRDAELVIVDPELPGGRRQIEWQEGAALQGFPDDYVFYGSPGDVWKMIGQAIQIDTGRRILEAIVKEACK